MTNTNAIILIDARSNSLTVTWPPTQGATCYRLEYRTTASQQDDDFELLSDKLTQTQARKRNLSPDHSYFFRVAAVLNDEDKVVGEWFTHDHAFQPISSEQEETSMAAPTVTNAGSNQALLISWTKVDGASGYELQMRENQGGADWTTIAPSLSGLEVKKKNLTSKLGYQFRVRPSSGSDSENDSPFSPPSDTAVAKGLSAGIQRFFNSLDGGTLLRSGAQQQPVPLADALGGKEFVLLYASAHWCPPCRKFTPMLANWYKTVRNNVEIVFLSADHDATGFKSYFATHPWMAVDYDDDARDNIMAAIKVSGIPRLVVLSGATGKIIDDNAGGKPLDLNRFRALNK
jgi:thiol-disulfide isomerase/thioredoxin